VWDSPDNCQRQEFASAVPLRGLLDLSGAVEASDTCARFANGTVQCLYESPIGQRITPVPLPELTSVAQISSRLQGPCARLVNGTVRCAKPGLFIDPSQTRLFRVAGVSDAREICTARARSCAREGDGSVACWGAPFGPSRDQPAEEAPERVAGVSHAVELACGSTFACEREADGRVLCWGSNDHGALGDGIGTDHGDARPVAGLHDASALAASIDYACARKSDDTMVCWGALAAGSSFLDDLRTVAIAGR
jgi:hypothetical protein